MTRAAAAWLAAGLLAGCSTLKPYPAGSPENALVSSAIDSGSLFSSMRGSLHIHEIDSACRTSYLVFVFEGSSFLGGSSSSSSSGALIKPRPGYRYEVTVTYRDSIYNVLLRESDPRRGVSRELSRQDLRGCKA
jgi:hypothetical protein